MKQIKYGYDKLSSVIEAISIIGTITMFICIVLNLCGLGAVSFNGFGVDSEGKLYVGRDGKIDILVNGEQIGTFAKYTQRGYVFTLSENDTILLADGTGLYEMDIDGTVIQETADQNTRIINRMKRSKYRFTDVHGNEYRAVTDFGYLRILHEDTVIYCLPILDYIVFIVTMLSIPCFFYFCHKGRQRLVR